MKGVGAGSGACGSPARRIHSENSALSQRHGPPRRPPGGGPAAARPDVPRVPRPARSGGGSPPPPKCGNSVTPWVAYPKGVGGVSSGRSPTPARRRRPPERPGSHEHNGRPGSHGAIACRRPRRRVARAARMARAVAGSARCGRRAGPAAREARRPGGAGGAPRDTIDIGEHEKGPGVEPGPSEHAPLRRRNRRRGRTGRRQLSAAHAARAGDGD